MMRLFFAFIATSLIVTSGFAAPDSSAVHTSFYRVEELIKTMELELAKEELQRLHHLSHSSTNRVYRGFFELQRSVYYKQLDDYEKAIEGFNKAYDIFLNYGNDTLAAKSLNHIAEIYRVLNNPKQSRDCYLKALRILEGSGYYAELARTYNNFANLHKKEGDLDSAIFYYQHANTLKEKHSVHRSGKTLHNIGTVFYMQNNLDEALSYFEEAIRIKNRNRDSTSLAFSYNEISLIHIEKGNYDLAKEYLLITSKLPLTIRTELRYLEIQSLFFERTGNFKEALKWKERYYQSYKKFLNEKQTKAILELDKKFETERKNNTISQQTASLKIQDKDIQLKNRLIGLLIIGVILIISILVAVWQRNKRIQRDFALRQLQARFDGAEKIKQTVSRNLHDVLGQNLNAIRIQLEALSISSERKNGINPSLMNTLNQSISQVRNISHELSPLGDRLVNNTFTSILNMTLAEFKQLHEIEITVSHPIPLEINQLTDEDKNHLYAIVLESLSNINKHAKASQVEFSLICNQKQTELKIQDNGIGYIQGNNGGIGIQNMHNRAKILQGKLSIQPSKNGTLLSLLFPLNT